MLLRTFWLCLLLISHGISIAADNQLYIRDYTYHASETDSKVSARQAALQQLQILVIQESGVKVQGTFSQSESLKNGTFTKSAQSEYLTFAQAYTKTKVIDEKWNGQTFYIKASIEIDTASLKNAKPLSNHGSCKTLKEKVQSELADIQNPKTQENLIALSQQHPFDNSCNAWQFLIIDKFREKNIINDEYRNTLYEAVKAAPDQFKGKLLYEVLRYSTNLRAISKDEFSYVKDAVQVMSHQDIRWIVEVLIDATSKSTAYDASQAVKDRNKTRQWVSMLDWQLSWFYKIAQEGNLGKPVSMTMPEIMAVAMERMSVKNQSAFLSYYFYNHAYLDDAANIKLHKKMVRYVKKNLNPNTLEILDLYIKDVPNNDRKLNSALFKLLMHIEKEGKKEPYFKNALDKLVQDNRKKVAYIIDGSKLASSKKEKWFNQYDLLSEFN